MKRTGLSLIELLVSALIMVMAIGVVARAFSAGLMFEDKSTKNRAAMAERLWFEDRLNLLLEGASLRGSNTYFVSPVPASVSRPGLTNEKRSNLGAGSDSLVFTCVSSPVPVRAIAGREKDFEAFNRQYGPLGGTLEVGLSLSAVGDSKGQSGLFLREQCPADGDLHQGGEEQVLGPTVRDVRFQFYTGTQWQDAWDSQNANKGKLPKLVRVRYQLANEQEPREILVRTLLADATMIGTSTNQGGQEPVGSSPQTPNPVPGGGASR